jgi:hypothetical protein
MGRAPAIPAEKKARIVLSVLAGELRSPRRLGGRWSASSRSAAMCSASQSRISSGATWNDTRCQARPASCTRIATCTRLVRSSLVSKRETCALTVASLM